MFISSRLHFSAHPVLSVYRILEMYVQQQWQKRFIVLFFCLISAFFLLCTLPGLSVFFPARGFDFLYPAGKIEVNKRG
jgi:hypothetical protein